MTEAARVAGAAGAKVAVTVEGAIGHIVLDNAARRNAMTAGMWQAIPDAVRQLEADDAVRVILLTGAGEQAFVSGADISEFEDLRAEPDKARAYEAMTDAAFAAVRRADKPTVARIRGYCMGGGLALALCCDLRYAADDAVFGIPAARLGVGYSPGGVRTLTEIVGPAHARDILITARRYSAAEAAAMGLVNRVVPVPDLDEAVARTAAQIAENAPLTIAAARACIDAVLEPDAVDAGEAARRAADCFASADYAEGRRAFLEKRTPRFEGE